MRFTRPGASADAVLRINVDLYGLQLLYLFLRHGVGGKHTGSDLAAGEILQPAWHPVRRIELRVEVRFRMWRPVGGGLVKRQNVRKRSVPEAVKFHQDRLERARKVATLV